MFTRILFLLALAAPVHAETRVYGPDKDGDAAVLTEAECTLPIVAPVRLMHAVLTNEKGAFAGCWAELGDGGVRIVWEPASEYRRWVMPTTQFRKLI